MLNTSCNIVFKNIFEKLKKKFYNTWFCNSISTQLHITFINILKIVKNNLIHFFMSFKEIRQNYISGLTKKRHGNIIFIRIIRIKINVCMIPWSTQNLFALLKTTNKLVLSKRFLLRWLVLSFTFLFHI